MNIIVLELILVLAVALGLGFWQLYDVNKALKKDRETKPQTGENHDHPAPNDQSTPAEDPAQAPRAPNQGSNE